MKNIYKKIIEDFDANNGIIYPYAKKFKEELKLEYMDINVSDSVINMVEEKSGLNSLIGYIEDSVKGVEEEFFYIEKKYKDFCEVISSVLWDSV